MLRNNKTIIKPAVWLLVITVLAAVVYWQLKPKQQTPEYITATAYIGDIENNVMASGKVKALNQVNVGSQVSGEVTTLYVEVGDEVKKGDLIAEIDKVTQQNNLDNQQATLQQSLADLQSSTADLGSKQAALKSAQADLGSKQSDLAQAKTDLARLAPLVQIDAISQQEYDNAKAKVTNAQAAVESSRAGIETAKAGIISSQASIANHQASLQKAQNNVNNAKQDLSRTTIRAPINGTIVAVATEQGTTVNASQSAPTIATLADLSSVRINAQISEADVIHVKAGMPAYFNIIGSPEDKFSSTLKAIKPAPESISSNSSTENAVYYIGYLEVPNAQQRFRIDMTAQVFIVTAAAKNALLIPASALQKGKPSNMKDNSRHAQPEYFVKVLNSDKTISEKPVRIGINNRVNVQILSGLQKGETVIVNEGSNSKNNERDSMF